MQELLHPKVVSTSSEVTVASGYDKNSDLLVHFKIEGGNEQASKRFANGLHISLDHEDLQEEVEEQLRDKGLNADRAAFYIHSDTRSKGTSRVVSYTVTVNVQKDDVEKTGIREALCGCVCDYLRKVNSAREIPDEVRGRGI